MSKYIHTADVHLIKAIPVCRTETEEEWLELQQKSLEALRDYTIEYDATLLIVGDIFDIPVASVTLVNMFLDVFMPIRDKVLISTGNHCLRGHNYENVEESSYGILRKSFGEIPDQVGEIGGFHFNQPYDGEHKIVCTHQLTYDSTDERDLCGSGKTAKQLLKEFPKATWLLTGDMHSKFIYEEKGRVVVNPGCVTRQSIKYADYKPSCYFIDTEAGDIEELFLPDDKAMLSTSHKDRIVDRDGRISEFLEIVQTKGLVSLDFIKNLEATIISLEDAEKAIMEEIVNKLKEED